MRSKPPFELHRIDEKDFIPVLFDVCVLLVVVMFLLMLGFCVYLMLVVVTVYCCSRHPSQESTCLYISLVLCMSSKDVRLFD